MHNRNSVCRWLKGVSSGHEPICHWRRSIRTQVRPEETNNGWGDMEKTAYWLQSNQTPKSSFALPVSITYQMHLNQKSQLSLWPVFFYLIYNSFLNQIYLFDLYVIELVKKMAASAYVTCCSSVLDLRVFVPPLKWLLSSQFFLRSSYEAPVMCLRKVKMQQRTCCNHIHFHCCDNLKL